MVAAVVDAACGQNNCMGVVRMHTFPEKIIAFFHHCIILFCTHRGECYNRFLMVEGGILECEMVVSFGLHCILRCYKLQVARYK